MALRRHHHFQSVTGAQYVYSTVGLTIFGLTSWIVGAYFSVVVSLLVFLLLTGIRVYSIHPDYTTMQEWEQYGIQPPDENWPGASHE